jgi:hypothetical protein
MSPTKGELIEAILKNQGGESDIVRSAEQVRPTISMMMDLAGGKQSDVTTLSRKLAESLVPIVKQAAREKYSELFTIEQLTALAEFLDDNSWYHDLSSQLTMAMSAVASERAEPIMKKLLEEYAPAEEGQ